MRTGRDRSMNSMPQAVRNLSSCCQRELVDLVLTLLQQMLSSYMTLIGIRRWICRLWYVMPLSLAFIGISWLGVVHMLNTFGLQSVLGDDCTVGYSLFFMIITWTALNPKCVC
jgi:hypothetical protein